MSDTPTQSIPEGFLPAYSGPYCDVLEGNFGPIYYRQVGDRYELGLRIEKRHCNVRNTAHGGFMAAMSDIASGFTLNRYHRATESMFVTISLSHQFIGSVPLGAWLTSICTIRKAGRSTLFLDCEHCVDSELVGLSHLVMKTTRRVQGADVRAVSGGDPAV